jgi:hypothetical protein
MYLIQAMFEGIFAPKLPDHLLPFTPMKPHKSIPIHTNPYFSIPDFSQKYVALFKIFNGPFAFACEPSAVCSGAHLGPK